MSVDGPDVIPVPTLSRKRPCDLPALEGDVFTERNGSNVKMEKEPKTVPVVHVLDNPIRFHVKKDLFRVPLDKVSGGNEL